MSDEAAEDVKVVRNLRVEMRASDDQRLRRIRRRTGIRNDSDAVRLALSELDARLEREKGASK